MEMDDGTRHFAGQGPMVFKIGPGSTLRFLGQRKSSTASGTPAGHAVIRHLVEHHAAPTVVPVGADYPMLEVAMRVAQCLWLLEVVAVDLGMEAVAHR